MQVKLSGNNVVNEQIAGKDPQGTHLANSILYLNVSSNEYR